ncbi:MAG: carboxypeptidase-like regulatory domain-containing protein [Blastocatellia bacterium]
MKTNTPAAETSETDAARETNVSFASDRGKLRPAAALQRLRHSATPLDFSRDALNYSPFPVALFPNPFANKTKTAKPNAYVWGHVRTPSGQGVANVFIDLNPGGYTNTTTDSAGYYHIEVEDGNYPVIPAKAGYTFTPASRQVSVGEGFDAPNTDFTSNAAYVISGTATNNTGEPMNGVTMTMTGGSSQSVSTGLNGQYSFAPVYAGYNYTVTPSKGGFAFTPASRTYTNLQAAQSNQNYTGTPPPPPPPAGGPQVWSHNVNYAYNTTGALSSVGTNLTGSDPNANANVISGIAYNGFGGVTTANYGNGRRLTLGYNVNRHQMISMKVDNQNGTNAIINKTYGYADPYNSQVNDGRIRKITDLVDANYTVNYAYDDYGELSTASANVYYREWIEPHAACFLRAVTAEEPDTSGATAQNPPRHPPPVPSPRSRRSCRPPVGHPLFQKLSHS